MSSFKQRCTQGLVKHGDWDGAFCEKSLRLLVVNYFCKTHHLRCFTRFWMHLYKRSINATSGGLCGILQESGLQRTPNLVKTEYDIINYRYVIILIKLNTKKSLKVTISWLLFKFQQGKFFLHPQTRVRLICKNSMPICWVSEIIYSNQIISALWWWIISLFNNDNIEYLLYHIFYLCE